MLLSGQWADCSGTASETCTTQNVGIGTIAPDGALEIDTSSTTVKPLIVKGSAVPGADLLTLYGFAGGTVFRVSTYGGALFNDVVAIGGSPTSNQELVVSNGSGPTRMGLVVRGTAAQSGDLQQWQNSSGTPLAVVNSQGYIGIGTSSPQSPLSVNGTVTAREVVVTSSGWPDYIFDPGHPPMPLSDLAAFIRKNRHLPAVPSAEQVAAKGIGLGEMQAKLLSCIEELTLYQIESEERSARLEGRNRELERR
ncbi:MAG TPA: hypothetical protein VHC90_06235, partial [Bryobacteraceae bacterium]|nr:hypothetical protein [Bryobacteraceae bacterium]